mmetsp:Transcript_16199/g.48654  ORF Transcript_16199/g.48654 Transcript_16199/m.48654 type:complete len:650 (-) Transcript_16199:135-2084(-)
MPNMASGLPIGSAEALGKVHVKNTFIEVMDDARGLSPVASGGREAFRTCPVPELLEEADAAAPAPRPKPLKPLPVGRIRGSPTRPEQVESRQPHTPVLLGAPGLLSDTKLRQFRQNHKVSVKNTFIATADEEQPASPVQRRFRTCPAPAEADSRFLSTLQASPAMSRRSSDSRGGDASPTPKVLPTPEEGAGTAPLPLQRVHFVNDGPWADRADSDNDEATEEDHVSPASWDGSEADVVASPAARRCAFMTEDLRDSLLEQQRAILAQHIPAGGTGSAPAADDSPMRVALADLLQQVRGFQQQAGLPAEPLPEPTALSQAPELPLAPPPPQASPQHAPQADSTPPVPVMLPGMLPGVTAEAATAHAAAMATAGTAGMYWPPPMVYGWPQFTPWMPAPWGYMPNQAVPVPVGMPGMPMLPPGAQGAFAPHGSAYAHPGAFPGPGAFPMPGAFPAPGPFMAPFPQPPTPSAAASDPPQVAPANASAAATGLSAEAAEVEPAQSLRLKRSGGSRRLRLWAHIYLHMQAPNFDLVPRLIGRGGANMRRIAELTNAKIRIRGRGSGHLEIDGKHEAPTPLMVAVTTDHTDGGGFKKAIELTIKELVIVQERFHDFCQKNGLEHEGPCFSLGLIADAAQGMLDDLPLLVMPQQLQ